MTDESLRRALRDSNTELLQHIEELSFVRLVGDALAGEAAVGAIAAAVVRLLCDELGVSVAALWHVDAQEGGVALLAVDGAAGADASVPGAVLPFAKAGVVGRAATGGTVRVGPEERAVLPSVAAGVAELVLQPSTLRERCVAVLGVGTVAGEVSAFAYERLLGLVAPTVALALEHAALCERLAAENRTLRAELGGRRGRGALVGASDAFRAMLAVVERLAEMDVTVLVLGESGTGKEVVARALHESGRRKAGPFVAVNCAALPESLLESELFGIERGVATGVERRAGLVERAHGGTLFLDEVGDMSPLVQAKLLRVLEEREVTRIGGARPTAVDVRVIAATHRDLEQAVAAARFRQDLYFRLKVATVRVPSLGERRDDVPLLAQHFLAELAAVHGRPELRLAPAATAALSARAWPGNVRELRNVLEQAVVMTGGPVVEAADLGLASAPDGLGEPGLRAAVRTAVGGAERALIVQALTETGQNRTHAARLLGISRRGLIYKLKRYGLTDGRS